MPRVRDSQSGPVDFCIEHFPVTEEEAFEEFGNLGDGPDGRGNCFAYNDDHPDYQGEGYTCHVCGKELTEVEDGAQAWLSDKHIGSIVRPVFQPRPAVDFHSLYDNSFDFNELRLL